MEQIPMYPMILSVSSGDPRGRGLNVIFITEYQEATTPLNKLERKKVSFVSKIRYLKRRKKY